MASRVAGAPTPAAPGARLAGQGRRRAPRAGFTLVEVLVAMVVLSGVVLAMTLGTSMLARSVVLGGGRARAQALADQQVARARVWPAYSSLPQLATAAYNGTVDGFQLSTVVTVDSLNRRHLTRVVVTVSSDNPALLSVPVRRSISIAAP